MKRGWGGALSKHRRLRLNLFRYFFFQRALIVFDLFWRSDFPILPDSRLEVGHFVALSRTVYRHDRGGTRAAEKINSLFYDPRPVGLIL